MNTFESRFNLGESVAIGLDGTPPVLLGIVRAVTFTKGKVKYDIDLDTGGEPHCNVDSIYVHPVGGSDAA